MALVTGEVHMELKASHCIQPYWSLLLPYEQRGPSRIRVRKRMRWTGRHNRIFDLEKELGFHDREAYDVLPWRHPVYDPVYDYDYY